MLCVVMLMSFAAQPKPARRCVGYGCVHALYFVLLWNGVSESCVTFCRGNGVGAVMSGGQEKSSRGQVLGGLCELWLLSGSSFFMTNNFEGYHFWPQRAEVAEQPAQSPFLFFDFPSES